MATGRGQGASEFMILFAGMLMVATVVLSVAVVWPSYVQAVQKQRSDDYWLAARPFVVKQNAIYPGTMVIELQNADPVTLNVTGIWLEGVRLDFYNHTVPFSWTKTARCGGGSCSMLVRPGQAQIISTVAFSTTPLNPCLVGSDFSPMTPYRMGLTISYRGTGTNATYNETGLVKLMGICTS